MAEPVKGRCVHCRADILVPDTYQHGDHVKCGQCGTRHKVTRGEREGVRLVLADVGPLRDALKANQTMVGRLEDELRGARHSIGLGANGLGIGVVYLIWQVALQDQPFSTGLLVQAVLVGLATGVALELLNYVALAKRKAITRISHDLEEAREEGRALQQKIRDSSRA
jgi:DNA-directed RNA polymerase subunit RPC12/RpoP